jgi:hypothetical protein
MTRLSEALKRAAETTATPRATTAEPPPPAGVWQFAPVETMYVPDEPRRSPWRATAGRVVPDLAPAGPTPSAYTDAPSPRASRSELKIATSWWSARIPIRP